MTITDFKLNTGETIPCIGFGTWQLRPGSATHRAVGQALQAGYRLIDTARIYGNEYDVGEAIRDSGVPRETLFVTSKVWNDDQGYDRTLTAFDATLERLGLDYLDLYLIHWPATSKRQDSWRALEHLYGQGRVGAAGVSNFTVRHLQDLMERSRLVPAVNQVEFHPFIYEQQLEVLDYCRQHGIVVEAYSPISRLTGEEHLPVTQLADKYHKSPQQIVLRWCVQHGTVPLARSADRRHLVGNLAISDFELSGDDMQILDGLSDGQRVTWDPADMG